MVKILVARNLLGKSLASVYILAEYSGMHDCTFELCGKYGVSQLHHIWPCIIEGCIKPPDFSSSYLKSTKRWNSTFSSGPNTDHCAAEPCLLLNQFSCLLPISLYLLKYLFHSVKVCYVTFSVLFSIVLMSHGIKKIEHSLLKPLLH